MIDRPPDREKHIRSGAQFFAEVFEVTEAWRENSASARSVCERKREASLSAQGLAGGVLLAGVELGAGPAELPGGGFPLTRT